MVATSTIKTKNTECLSELVERRYDPAWIEKELDLWDRGLASQHNAVAATAGEDDSACARQLAKTFEECLSRAKKTTLHCSAVLVPEKLTRHAACHVLRLASVEPCGLRGCVLYVQLEVEGGACVRPLECVAWDAGVVPTFELTLVFKQDCGGGGGRWPGLRELFTGACFFARGFHRAVKLSPGFRLVKRKLYSPGAAGTVVVEC